MKRRFEARHDRAVYPRKKVASMKGLTTNQTSSATTPGISKDTARVKKVKFKSSRWEHGETSSHEREAPKTSEYAYFKKFKNNAGFHSHSLAKDKQSKDSEEMNNYQDLRFSTHVEKVRPINYYCSPSSPAVTATLAPEPMYARGNHHHSFHTPLVGEKQLLNCDLNQSPLHQKYKYSDADVFSKKRKKLCHLIAETSSREVKQLSLKGQDLVTALLSRLFPQGNENNLCRTEKPKDTKSSIFPESLAYYTSREIEWEDCQSDPMMGKDDLWLSVDNSPLECDSRRSREKYLPKWGTTSISQPRSRNGDIFKFNHHCDATIPDVSDFDKSHYSFDVDNYNLEGEYQQHKRSRDKTGWESAVDYQPPLTRLWERFCNENKITRYDYFDHRLTSSTEKYSRPYTGTYEWFGDFGSTTHFKQPTEVLDRRVLTVGRESSLPLLGWDYENSTTESEQMSLFPQLPASSTGDCNIPPDWSVNDELNHQTFVYRYPLRFNTPLLPYYHSTEDLQPQYPGRRDYLICGEEEDEISDFANVAADDQSSSPGIFSSMVVLF